MVLIAAIGLAAGELRPVSLAEAARIARAEVLRRDPSFTADAPAYMISAAEVNYNRPWMSHWQVAFKRPDSQEGYLVDVNGRWSVKVARAWNITRFAMAWCPFQ